MFLRVDGTFTGLLAAFADEPIMAVKLEQKLGRVGESDAPLDLPGGAAVLRRRVLLRGARSGRNLVYASAVLATDRIDPAVLEALATTSRPIGSILAEHRTETFREILRFGRVTADLHGVHFALPPSAVLLVRSYRVFNGGRPIMLITEKLPAHVSNRSAP